MALRWPLLLVLVLAAVAVAAYFALRRGRHGWQGELPLLARSYRLTELPEYQRAIRWHERVAIVALVSSIVAVVALIGATVRPAWTYEPHKDAGDTPYVDIMLCFDDEYSFYSADRDLLPLLNVLRDRVQRFGNQRVGMTHAFYRIFPVTADHQWAAERLDAIIGAATEHDKVSAGDSLAGDDVFRRDVYKVRPTLVDTLAVCTMGLPSVGRDNGRGRAIVYIGRIADFDDPGVQPPDKLPERIYPKATLEKAIKSARIQLNAIVPGTRGSKPAGFVDKSIRDTGGKEIRFTPLDAYGKPSQLRQDNLKDELSNAVDKILSNPPPSALDQTHLLAARSFQWDVPDLFLQIALLAAVALGAARLGMRL